MENTQTVFEHSKATHYPENIIRMNAKLVLIEPDDAAGPWALFEEDFKKGNFVIFNLGFADAWSPGIETKLELGTNYRITGLAYAGHNLLDNGNFKLERRNTDGDYETIASYFFDKALRARFDNSPPEPYEHTTGDSDWSNFDPDWNGTRNFRKA